jgi:hypothetical protein
MSWCVNHGYELSVVVYIKASNLLRYATMLLLSNVGVPEEVKQGGFTVINVPHYSNYGRSLAQLLFFIYLELKPVNEAQ